MSCRTGSQSIVPSHPSNLLQSQHTTNFGDKFQPLSNTSSTPHADDPDVSGANFRFTNLVDIRIGANLEQNVIPNDTANVKSTQGKTSLNTFLIVTHQKGVNSMGFLWEPTCPTDYRKEFSYQFKTKSVKFCDIEAGVQMQICTRI